MDIQAIYSLIKDDMQAVDHLIQQRLTSSVPLINDLGHYIINSGGKRVRPALTLLCAKACGYLQGTQSIQLATIIEFIHTATLLHDDVVDNSQLRRGAKTANAQWGNEASVLVGDFLYTRAFEMMVEMDTMAIMRILAHATNIIAEGEVLQLMNCHQADTTEAAYFEVIHHKTAKLFEAASELGAIVANSDQQHQKAMRAFGMHIGSAFQLIDDLLDYSDSSASIGKNIGDDLAEGKPTLPLIYAMQNAPPQQQAYIQQAIEQGSRDNIATIVQIIQSCGAIEYTQQAAEKEIQLAKTALDNIDDSTYKVALLALADYALTRPY